MKFHLVDRIESVEPGARIVTTKALSLAEEYLADHFPAFPILPGVMMLEALVQSAAWLVRLEQDFSKSIVVLGSARNVKYANMVQPGNTLRCEIDVMSIGQEESKFKATGTIDGKTAVSARLILRSFNLADTKGAYLAQADRDIVAQVRRTWDLVHGPRALQTAAEA
ncbi:MAG: 3-hydroxyacyl-ACP dehydratase FabZ family protein [Phycisphaerae bacterium]